MHKVLKWLVYISLIFCAGVAHAQSIDASSRSRQLKIYFDRGFIHKKKDSLTYQKLFFNTFPGSFATFDEVFGYDDKKGAAPLYNVANQYTDKLFSTKAVKVNVKARKLIHIALNGKWDADAISHFQYKLHQFVKGNFATFMAELNKFNNAEIESVWKFCFDVESAGYRKKLYEDIFNRLGKNQGMIQILFSAYKKATSEQIH